MPLRTTVAAGILLASGWKEAASTADNSSPLLMPSLLDPFCGSGSIAIEAAGIALGMPPQRADVEGRPSRAFALQSWPRFDAGTWASVMHEAQERHALASARIQQGLAAERILGTDRNAGAVRGARENAQRAGLEGAVQFRVASFSESMCESLSTAVPVGGLICTNPPWGHRSAADKGDGRHLYQRLGGLFRQHRLGARWHLSLLVRHLERAHLVDRHLTPCLKLTIGGLKTWMMSNAVER